MAWEDRDYYRDPQNPSFASDPLRWLLYGRIRLYRAFGITVYLHAALLVVAVLVLILPGGFLGNTFADKLTFIVVLFGIVLLHEYGHCWGARRTGGTAEEILLTPLGGLAMTLARKKPWPMFVTVVCGPLVNVLICLVAGAVVWATVGILPLGPYSFGEGRPNASWFNVAFYAWWIYTVSYFLLLFNLLPIWPLDGGQLVQTALWPKFGYHKSMLWTTTFGLYGSGALALYGLATGFNLLLILIAVSCFANCLQMRRLLLAEGPWAFQDEDEPDWSKSLAINPNESEKVGRLQQWRERRAEARAQKEAEAAAARERQVDEILAKISRTGRDSLTASERRVLEQATQARRARPG